MNAESSERGGGPEVEQGEPWNLNTLRLGRWTSAIVQCRSWLLPRRSAVKCLPAFPFCDSSADRLSCIVECSKRVSLDCQVRPLLSALSRRKSTTATGTPSDVQLLARSLAAVLVPL